MTPRLKGVAKPACLLAVGVTIASTTCTAATAVARRHANCLPAHARTIAADREVRVYSLEGTTLAPGGTYACLLRRGTTVALAKSRPYRPFSIAHTVLDGAILAYTYSSHGVDTGSTDIAVLDVAKRRTLLTILGAGGFTDACVIGFREVTDLVVTDRGAVSWIVRKGTRCHTTTFEVHSAQAHAAPVLLEEGPAIVPGSLRLLGQTVSWVNAGQRKSARLR